MVDQTISTKLARALLLYQGELTVSEIKALPFVRNNNDVALVVAWLQTNYDVECYLRKINSVPISEWEQVISLRHKMPV